MAAPVATLSASSLISGSADNKSLTLIVPSTATPGRQLLAILSFASTLTITDPTLDGWTLIVSGATCRVYARECSDNEPASYGFVWTGAMSGTLPTAGALIVMKNLMVEAGGDIATGTTAVAGATVTTTTTAAQDYYTDGSLTLVIADNDDGFTESGGDGVETSAEGVCNALDASVLVLFDRRESAAAVPAFAVHPVTVGGLVNWVQFVFRGGQPLVASKLTQLDPAGTIGLPFEGV